MQAPLKIAFEGGLEASDALRTRIENEARKLEQFSDRITARRVAVVGRSERRHQGDLYSVRVQIVMPGRDDVLVTRNHDADHSHEDAYVAIHDAFKAARRQLEDHERASAARSRLTRRRRMAG